MGIYAPRSLETLIGLLGILKAGGAYLPLDPDYPQDRLSFIIRDAQPDVLITCTSQVEAIHGHEAKVVDLQNDWEVIAKQSTENRTGRERAADLAYVIYTSGSTGRPKGVMGLHSATINRFAWMWDRYPIKSGEVFCQKTSLSFVDSVWEIFGPLSCGVKTVIVPDNVVKDPRKLVEQLALEHVNRIVLVPSLLNAILDTHGPLQPLLPDVTHWFSGGEVLSSDLARRFYDRMDHGLLVNIYGSSEVAADVTSYDVSEPPAFTSVSIGRPIDNSQTYILNRKLWPVPIGVAGELVVGGFGLARGYLNRTS